eukprot:5504189-Pleurochrysis_carterae.AAC.2
MPLIFRCLIKFLLTFLCDRSKRCGPLSAVVLRRCFSDDSEHEHTCFATRRGQRRACNAQETSTRVQDRSGRAVWAVRAAQACMYAHAGDLASTQTLTREPATLEPSLIRPRSRLMDLSREVPP